MREQFQLRHATARFPFAACGRQFVSAIGHGVIAFRMPHLRTALIQIEIAFSRGLPAWHSVARARDSIDKSILVFKMPTISWSAASGAGQLQCRVGRAAWVYDNGRKAMIFTGQPRLVACPGKSDGAHEPLS